MRSHNIFLASSICILASTSERIRLPSPWASFNNPGTALAEVRPEPVEIVDLERIEIQTRYHSFAEEMETFPSRRPYATNLGIATVKGFLADAFVQLGERSKKSHTGFDWKRSVLFTLFGFLYAGVVEWIIYIDIFSILCPNMLRFANETWEQKWKDPAGQYDLLKQILFDNFIHYTFVYYPIFYSLKEMVQGPAGLDVIVDAVGKGLKRYRRNMATDLCRIWAFSIPGDLLVFTIPMWLRMPVNHAQGFIWTMILSFLRGAEKDEEPVNSCC